MTAEDGVSEQYPLTPFCIMDEMQWFHYRLAVVTYWECIPRLVRLPGSTPRHWRSIANKLRGGQTALVESGFAVMPKPKVNGTDKTEDKAGDQYFKIAAWVNLRLSEDDKRAINELDLQWPDVFAWMGERVFAGYRFSFAFDEYSKACQLSVICRAEGDPNYGLAMSSRHPDPDLVFVSLYYKDVVMLQGDWASNRPTPEAGVWD